MSATSSFSQPAWVLMLSQRRSFSSWYSAVAHTLSLPASSFQFVFLTFSLCPRSKRSLYLSLSATTASLRRSVARRATDGVRGSATRARTARRGSYTRARGGGKEECGPPVSRTSEGRSARYPRSMLSDQEADEIRR